MIDRAAALAEIGDQFVVGLAAGPGSISSAMISAIAGCAAIRRTNFTAASISATSSSVE